MGFPKFFTPNADGDFDTWQVKGVSSQFQPNTAILIFDRYGKLLKELDPLSNGWNGTYNGSDMPSSDYWFKVTLEDGRIFTSHFTLKR
ncbi:T9SS type B sorting domain-containing protein [Winogradskyella sp.]|nr:T9SS type B sorting domain-containing protein [Winogradskyella sp.]MDB9782473.1 T9SS type B sorting domain-containing protein [Winogradskyella sp.]MDC0007133.1 T9SS type B sorting domain-containing protein [Winogradskyella sp.]MDC1505590.1 T9SS type B sorting domain-containing protein [Winogradskyella sp.]